MIGKLARASTRNSNRGGGPNLPTVSTTVGNSSIIDISDYAWGGVVFTEDPGTVTFYVRADKDDSWRIARERKSKASITDTPGTEPTPLHDELFYWNEMKITSSSAISAGACRLSFKS